MNALIGVVISFLLLIAPGFAQAEPNEKNPRLHLAGDVDDYGLLSPILIGMHTSDPELWKSAIEVTKGKPQIPPNRDVGIGPPAAALRIINPGDNLISIRIDIYGHGTHLLRATLCKLDREKMTESQERIGWFSNEDLWKKCDVEIKRILKSLLDNQHAH